MASSPSSLHSQQVSSAAIQYEQIPESPDNVHFDQLLLPDAVWIQDLVNEPSMFPEWDTPSQPEAFPLWYDYYEERPDIDICTHEEGFGIIEEFFPSYLRLGEIESGKLQIATRPYASLEDPRRPEPSPIPCSSANEATAAELPMDSTFSNLRRSDLDQQSTQRTSISTSHEANELATPHDAIEMGPNTTVSPHVRYTEEGLDFREDHESADSKETSLVGMANQPVKMSSDEQDQRVPVVGRAFQGQDAAVGDTEGQDASVVERPEVMDSPPTPTPDDPDMSVIAIKSCVILPEDLGLTGITRPAFANHAYATPPNELDGEPAAIPANVGSECDAIDACTRNQPLFRSAGELNKEDIEGIDTMTAVEATSPAVRSDATLAQLHIENEADKTMDELCIQVAVSPSVGSARQCLTPDVVQGNSLEQADFERSSVSIRSHDSAREDEDLGFQGNAPRRRTSPAMYILSQNEGLSDNKSAPSEKSAPYNKWEQKDQGTTANRSMNHLESSIDENRLPSDEATPHEDFIEKVRSANLHRHDDTLLEPPADVTIIQAPLIRYPPAAMFERLETSQFTELPSSLQGTQVQLVLPMDIDSKVRAAVSHDQPDTPPATPLREPDSGIEQDLTPTPTPSMASLELHSSATSATKDTMKRSLAVADVDSCENEGPPSKRQRAEPTFECMPKDASLMNETVAENRHTGDGDVSISVALDVMKVDTQDNFAAELDSAAKTVVLDNKSPRIASKPEDDDNLTVPSSDRAAQDADIELSKIRDQAINTVSSIEQSTTSHQVPSLQICGAYVQTADASMQERINTVSVSPTLAASTLPPNDAVEVPSVQTTDSDYLERVCIGSKSSPLAAYVQPVTSIEGASASLQALDADLQDGAVVAPALQTLALAQPDTNASVEDSELRTSITDAEMQERILTASVSPSLAASGLPPDTATAQSVLDSQTAEQNMRECTDNDSALMTSTAPTSPSNTLPRIAEVNVQTTETQVQEPNTIDSMPHTPLLEVFTSASSDKAASLNSSHTVPNTSEPIAASLIPLAVSSDPSPNPSTAPRRIILRFKPLKRPTTPVESVEAASEADERSDEDQTSNESEDDKVANELSDDELFDRKASDDGFSNDEVSDDEPSDTDLFDVKPIEFDTTESEPLKAETTPFTPSKVEHIDPNNAEGTQSGLESIKSRDVEPAHPAVDCTTSVPRDDEALHTERPYSPSSQSSDLSSVPATEVSALSGFMGTDQGPSSRVGEALPFPPPSANAALSSTLIEECTPASVREEGVIVDEAGNRRGCGSPKHEAETPYGRRATRSETQVSDRVGGGGNPELEDGGGEVIDGSSASASGSGSGSAFASASTSSSLVKEELYDASVSSSSRDGDADAEKAKEKGRQKTQAKKTSTSLRTATTNTKKQTRAAVKKNTENKTRNGVKSTSGRTAKMPRVPIKPSLEKSKTSLKQATKTSLKKGKPEAKGKGKGKGHAAPAVHEARTADAAVDGLLGKRKRTTRCSSALASASKQKAEEEVRGANHQAAEQAEGTAVREESIAKRLRRRRG